MMAPPQEGILPSLRQEITLKKYQKRSKRGRTPRKHSQRVAKQDRCNTPLGVRWLLLVSCDWIFLEEEG